MIPDARIDREYEAYERDRLAKARAGVADKRNSKKSKWRVFEDTTHGYWGIEIDGDQDADPIMYPIKIRREVLDNIVAAHNAA
ncbi:hypothetical protein [Sinorhizobium medicae]